MKEGFCVPKVFLLKKLSFVTSLIAMMSLTNVVSAADGASTAAQKIIMKSISFEPKKIQIHENDSLIWVNGSLTEHSATSDDGKAFDTGLIKPKKSSKPIVFKKAGTYPYHCSVHGKTMSGEVTVQATPQTP